MMIALYSINLRIMGQPTLSLLQETTIFKQLETMWAATGIDGLLNGMLASLGMDQLPETWGLLLVMMVVTVLIKFITDYYLKRRLGWLCARRGIINA